MIGYNIAEINTLINKICTSYKKLGETIAAEWPAVSKVIVDEWTGPDRNSFEERLASRIVNLYHSCHQNLSELIANLKKTAGIWREFQKNNIIEGALHYNVGSLEITNQQLEVYEIETVVKHVDDAALLNESTFWGVKNGQGSATLIDNAVSQYVENISTKVKAMYTDVTSFYAFIGTQTASIDQYITSISNELAILLTTVDDLRSALAVLVKNYVEQDASVSSSYGNIS